MSNNKLFYASSALFRLTALTEKVIEKLLEPTTSSLWPKKLHNHDENDDGRECAMVFKAIILKRGYVWSTLTTTTTMS